MKKVRFREHKRELESAHYFIALTLLQKHEDEHGKKLCVLSLEEVKALTPRQRRELRLKGWGGDLSYEDFVSLRIKPSF